MILPGLLDRDISAQYQTKNNFLGIQDDKLRNKIHPVGLTDLLIKNDDYVIVEINNPIRKQKNLLFNIN